MFSSLDASPWLWLGWTPPPFAPGTPPCYASGKRFFLFRQVKMVSLICFKLVMVWLFKMILHSLVLITNGLNYKNLQQSVSFSLTSHFRVPPCQLHATPTLNSLQNPVSQSPGIFTLLVHYPWGLISSKCWPAKNTQI